MNDSAYIEVRFLNLKSGPVEHILQIFYCLNADDRKRSDSFMKKDDRLRFLGGRFLLHQYLKETGKPDSLCQIKLDEYKRPRLDNISFSISHSEDWVVLAAGPVEISIGIDLEVCVPRHIPDYLEPFGEVESRYILEENQLKRFYQAWTKKESALKAIGKGFLFDAIDINTRLQEYLHEGRVYNWYELCVTNDVVAHLCHDRKETEVKLKMT